MRSDKKTILVIAFLAVAVVLAIVSITRTIGANQGHSVGSLGDLSGDRGIARPAGLPTTTPSNPDTGTGKAAEVKGGDDAASGAPPEASAQGSGQGR